MTEDNQNNEFKPQPLPGQVFIRPGIDDRPDYEKTLTPEAKAAMRRLSVQQHPRIPEASNERPETQAARIASEGGAPLTAAAHLDVAVPNLESSFLDLRDPMTAPDGIVRIPLNESSDPKSQINEYLDAYKGEGIQHIACFTDDIYTTVEKMREAGVEFLDTPDTYFEVIDQRIPNHGEDVARLARNKILIDADVETKQRKLLQIFTQNALGPIFFEIIQRKGNEGFGEGNFQALFESIERDQMKRGVL